MSQIQKKKLQSFDQVDVSQNIQSQRRYSKFSVFTGGQIYILKNKKVKIILIIFVIIIIVLLALGFVSFMKQNKQQIEPQIPITFQPTKPLYLPTKQQLQNLDPKKDLILTTLSGRRQYMKILYKYISKQRNSFYLWHLWVNTNNTDDLNYLKKLSQQNNWIKLIQLEQKNLLWGPQVHFYKQDCLKNKIYLRFDDDTHWIEDNFIQKMFDQRLRLSNTFIVFANIINNAITTHIHQRFGQFKYPLVIQNRAQGNGWKNPEVGAAIHLQFIDSIKKNQTYKWKTFNQWHLLSYQRFSINSMIYYSQTIRQIEYFDHQKGQQWIYTVVYPKKYKIPLVVVGNAICVHGAFWTQRDYFNQYHPQILKSYQQIASQI